MAHPRRQPAATAVVKPPARPGGPPSDAIALFDGTDLSRWGVRNQAGALAAANWPIADGVMTAGPGMLTTRESYGDVQLHVEFAVPAAVSGTSQARGNSGLIFMGQYELQILDSYSNRTYADGMGGGQQRRAAKARRLEHDVERTSPCCGTAPWWTTARRLPVSRRC